jgi:hypothetical protein
MRLWVRHAQIEPVQRAMFERYGTFVLQLALVNTPTGDVHVQDELRQLTFQPPLRAACFAWLTEQHDIDERSHTVTLMMEAAILLFVGVEMTTSLYDLWRR